MTKEERHLWYDFLKSLSVTVHRQKVIGQYIADFYIASAKLVIELDGSQHYEAEKQQQDSARTAYFHRLGFTVFRYPNSDVNERFQDVCQDIYNHLFQAK
jgi:very-short-patch-repair endonuclease